MKKNPKTREEAENQRYGCWAGLPKGNAYNPRFCACHIMTGGRGSLPTQCGKSPGHGPENLYCKQHAEKVFPSDKGDVWRVSKYDLSITKERYSSATESTITLFGSTGISYKINTQYERYLFSPETAKAYVRSEAKGRIRLAKLEIQKWEGVLKKNT